VPGIFTIPAQELNIQHAGDELYYAKNTEIPPD
jgi:hypothetical protein